MSKLFDYIGAINKKDGPVPRDDLDAFNSEYNQYVVNNALSYFEDTIKVAQEMTSRHNLTNLQHFDLLYNIVPKRNRYEKWHKSPDSVKIDLICRVYGYSIRKAYEVVDLISDEDVNELKKLIYEGGKV